VHGAHTAQLRPSVTNGLVRNSVPAKHFDRESGEVLLAGGQQQTLRLASWFLYLLKFTM
jgi:hypothetical protein